MIYWENAGENDQILLKALVILFKKHPKLLLLMLDKDSPHLATSPAEIKSYASVLSSGEQLLVHIGLDIWDSCGGIHFDDLYRKLDPINFQQVISVLLFLRTHR